MMGTNFYFKINPRTMKNWKNGKDEDDIDKHIGKRSCAGMGKTRFSITDLQHINTLKALAMTYINMQVCYDEYNQLFTAQEMLNEINECDFIKESKYKFS